MGPARKAVNRLIAWFVYQRPLMIPGMKYVELNYYAGRIPLIRRLHPWVKSKRNSSSYLPFKVTVNKAVGEHSEEILPPQILHELIDEAEVHVIMDHCLCRKTQQCENHPDDIGCMFMGRTAAGIPEKISRRVTKAQAHAHVEKAMKAGLTPMAGKVRVDNFLFLAPEKHQLLSVCFCCHCCCMMGYYKHAGRQMDNMMIPLEGAKVLVTDKCKGCGTCIETCIFDAIELKDGRAVHNDSCRVCGRCVRYCPNNAVSLILDDPDYKEKAKRRILSYVDVK